MVSVELFLLSIPCGMQEEIWKESMEERIVLLARRQRTDRRIAMFCLMVGNMLLNVRVRF